MTAMTLDSTIPLSVKCRRLAMTKILVGCCVLRVDIVAAVQGVLDFVRRSIHIAQAPVTADPAQQYPAERPDRFSAVLFYLQG